MDKMILKNKRQKYETLTLLPMLSQKKGAEKILSVYWFAILILVAGAIVYMVSAFYGQPYDVREMEANIMINKVAECLSEKGILKYELNEDFEKEFLDICKLNFNTQDEQEQYYLEIEFSNFETSQILDFKIVKGNINLKNSFDEIKESNSFVELSKSFYVLDNGGQELIVKITSIIGKENKNAK